MGQGTGTGAHYTSHCLLSDLDMHQLGMSEKQRLIQPGDSRT